MIKTLFSALLTLFAIQSVAQEAEFMLNEGKKLYRSEMASWNGTDLFKAEHSVLPKVGGYFSYEIADSTRCLFFSTDSIPVVIASYTFDSTFALQRATRSNAVRLFTGAEQGIFAIRAAAVKRFTSDSFFKVYPDTNPNFIVLTDIGVNRVYVMSGPTKGGVIIFGGDYLMVFDEHHNCTAKRELHANINPMNYKEHPEAEGAMHTHLASSGDFISPTDICTLMLYEKFTKWKRYSVISTKYTSEWNCETNQLTVTVNAKK